MARPNIAPYGSWKSPVTAEVVAGGEVGLEQVRLDGDDVYWIERRSQESGRKVIVRRSPDGRATDVTPASLNARTRVHEYGGGDYAVSDGTIVFANFTDQRLYAQRVGSPPRPLTPAASLRYADGVIDRRRNLLFCVCEDHTGHGEAINTLVSIDLQGGGAGNVLLSGNDFYSSPRLSPDGSQLAWLTWNHPNMPWDGTELWVGKLNEDESMSETMRAAGDRVVFIGASSTEPTSIVSLNLTTKELEVLRRSREIEVDAGYLANPRAIEFPTEGGLTAHGYFYPPQNRDYVGPADEKPPLLVMSHGGPTSATSTSLRYTTQYWTSRGIAVLDVNYGGSSGYGREYRERLKGQWGIVDVDDCVNGARYLVEAGAVDGNRLAIRRGSAGGYTTLCALTFRDAFKAGASHYGISDLEALAKDTHKFESRYLDGLIGPYPERRDLYVERSPIHFTDRLACPMILFQGLEEKVVPPKQAEEMFEAVRAKGLPVAYLTFEGEQHGFRKAENIKRVLEAELYFYSKVFKFELADPVEPVKIENL